MYKVRAGSSQNLIFYEFLKLLKNQAKDPVLQGISSKMARREFSIFIIFSDSYTCSYAMYRV